MASAERFIGLMSGTSLDGVDAVLMDFAGGRNRLLGEVFIPYGDSLRTRLLALHDPHSGELHDAAVLGIELARIYARAVATLLKKSGARADSVQAVGCHGQTIRHRPDAGYTIQLVDGALLAELAGIHVVCDFRSRDIAAGGEGAPLVPAFHRAVFGHPTIHRVIVNIGGIANVTDLPESGKVRGFDTGPGNMLMDAWVRRHRGKPFDEGGRWGGSMASLPDLLDRLLRDDYFSRQPPKSTGRELFNLPWLERHLSGNEHPAAVQATLVQLTATSIANDIRRHCAGAREILVCGGGARNATLLRHLESAMKGATVTTTDQAGIGADWVEACAFAWLARQALQLRPGNLPSVTGARGLRVLGSIHPK